jgi:hypothetical protein
MDSVTPSSRFCVPDVVDDEEMPQQCAAGSLHSTRIPHHFVIITNPNKAQSAGDQIVALMAELATIWPLLSEEASPDYSP